MCLGLVSLISGISKGWGPSNPIFTIGQTWLGLAVTIVYTYFGLSEQDTAEKNEKNKKRRATQTEVAVAVADGEPELANTQNIFVNQLPKQS